MLNQNNPILVTGGCGFIGANFIIDWLETKTSSVINLDLLTYSGNQQTQLLLNKYPGYIFVQGDVCDADLVAMLLNKYKPSAIIHFAAETHVDKSIVNPEIFIKTNIIGTFTLLEAVRKYLVTLDQSSQDSFRFLNVSTDEVYGTLNATDTPFSEQHQYQPNNPYSASKASADHLVRAWYHTFGLPVITTHCSNNYGPLQYIDKFIPIIITNALQHRKIPIYGDGKQVRDWLYVKDHCQALRRCLESGKCGEHYNIGSKNEATNLQVVHNICQILDEISPPIIPKAVKINKYSDLICFVQDRPGHDRRYAIDAKKIQDELSWQPKESFAKGLAKTVEWYVANYREAGMHDEAVIIR